MSAYRFCRTDDIALLVEAWNRCGPEPMTIADFKQEIRELDLWCSSCMVGFEADEPVAVVHGCKRPPYTLVRRIAVHPGHRRKGHGRHLLTSLSAKLAILGPPQLVAEIPAENAAARALFEACGWREAGSFSDAVLDHPDPSRPQGAIVPVTLDDVPEALPPDAAAVAWERMAETLRKRADRLTGLAVLSAERIEASVFYTRDGIWAFTGDPLPLTGEVARREGTPVALRSITAAAPEGFRAARTLVRFTTAAKPA